MIIHIAYMKYILYLCTGFQNIDTMNILFTILLSVFTISEDLSILDQEIAHSAYYDIQHERYIDSLRESLHSQGGALNTYLEIIDATASYQFDSAYHYVQLIPQGAYSNRDQQALIKIQEAFIYFSAGLFKEAYDILDNIPNIQHCSRLVQARYYSHFSRLCFDLGTYAGAPFYDKYTQRGIELQDKQLALLTSMDTVDYYYAHALQEMKREHYHSALTYFEKSLSGSAITDHERAITYSTMAFPAEVLGDADAALHYMILAAIYDIRSCTKEGIALRMVASMLHQRGESAKALQYITRAKQDADFYGARHRQMEISMILPIIEHEQLQKEQQMRTIIIITLACLSLLVIVLALVLFYLRHKLQALSEAHASIEQMNQRLTELGKLKEEYIGTFFAWQSDVIRSIDAIHTRLNKLARERDLKGLVAYIEAIPNQNRRQEFMQRFDRMFLKICPNFVENFNALLQPEYRITPKEGELLTTELRIFALIRLGITDNEKIAQVLDYSVNTVYTYKTKMRNRSTLSGEEFYAAAAKC